MQYQTAYREVGAVIYVDRLWNNLLTSQALVFNLFGPFKQNFTLANAVMRRLVPNGRRRQRTAQATRVMPARLSLDPPSAWLHLGDWGPDDERGRLNLLTPEKVLQGIAEMKTGKTFCLSLPPDYPGGAILSPRRHPPVLKPTMRGEKPNMNYPLRCDDSTATDVVCDDQVIMALQYSTQWDSLAHVGQMFDADGDGKAEDVFYNGYRPGRDIIGPAYYDEKGNMTPCDQPQGRVIWVCRTWLNPACRAAA